MQEATAIPETAGQISGATGDPEGRIYSLLTEKDEITWKDLLFDIISSEGMDPWNISISRLSSKYIDAVRAMKRLDLKVSGKVVLAATLLLRYKSKRLIGEDLDEFDRLLAQQEMSQEEFYDDLAKMRDPSQITDAERLVLVPRMPQPRTRKVSIYDLVGALEKALEVKKRRILRTMPPLGMTLPGKKVNIEIMIREVYKNVLLFFKRGLKRLTFGEITKDSKTKQEKIIALHSLLYLYNKRKVDLHQEQHFGEIDISLVQHK